MRIAMIGTGYVGLVSGACFMKFGVDVVCVDKDESKIDKLQAGEIPIYEPGLDALVAEGFESGRLTVTTNLKEAVADADAVFIAVGTPSRRGDGWPAGDRVLCSSARLRVVAEFVGQPDASEALGQPVHRHHALHCACQR